MVLTLIAAVLIVWQSERNRIEQGRLHAQLNNIEKSTKLSSSRAVIETLPYPPFRRTDGHLEINSLVTNTGPLPSSDTVWSSKLWVFWDSEVPQEQAEQSKFEDKLWLELQTKKEGAISGDINPGSPQFRSTVGDDVIPEEDMGGITNGQKVVYVLVTIHYAENHETNFCGFYWGKNKGAYQACREHNSSH